MKFAILCEFEFTYVNYVYVNTNDCANNKFCKCFMTSLSCFWLNF